MGQVLNHTENEWTWKPFDILLSAAVIESNGEWLWVSGIDGIEFVYSATELDAILLYPSQQKDLYLRMKRNNQPLSFHREVSF